MWTPRARTEGDEAEPRVNDDLANAARALEAERDADEVVTATSELSVHTPGSSFSSSAVPELGDLDKSLTPDEIEDGLRALETSPEVQTRAPTLFDNSGQIDESTGDLDRELDELVAESNRALGRERSTWLARAAELAHSKMGNLTRATELYIEAFDFAPGDEALISAAEPIFDQAGRGVHFTKLLRAQADEATDKATATFLHSKVAARCTAESDFDGAIAAYQALLFIEIGVDALRALISLLERAGGREAELSQALEVLAQKVDVAEACPLRFRRASLLAFNLHDLEGAKQELRILVLSQAGQDMPALEFLAQLAKETEDAACLAEAREQQLKLYTTDDDRISCARSLADLYEGVLEDPGKAIASLQKWASFDRANPEPYLRLVPLLEQAQRFETLRSVLDVLSTLSSDGHAPSQALLRAAQISMHELDDYEGAWQRLLPSVLAGDAVAEALLREVAEKAGRGEALAELFVRLAQQGDDSKVQAQRWIDAAHTYEALAGSVDKALEAMLRAFAKDMSNTAVLDDVDRLAALAENWPRLSQVYDALVRHAGTVEARSNALLRHASLLEHKANDASQAFERVLQAFSLDPHADHVYAEARRLGQVAGRTEDLIGVHERRANDASDTNQKIDALIEAARLAQRGADGVLPAAVYLTRAVVQAADHDDALDRVERFVRDADEQHGTHGHSGLTRTLCEVYSLCAEEERTESTLGTNLLRRTATLLEHEAHDLDGAYGALTRAAALSPADEALLGGLFALATRAGKLDGLAAFLQQTADDAIDADTASVVLERLLALYEGVLAAPDKAAEVCAKLVVIKPHDLAVADKHRAYLEQARNFNALLVAIERQLTLVTAPHAQRPLLEQAAHIWETELNNRFEAHALWAKVLSLYPEDERAAQAVERLGARVSVNERELLDGDLVVEPEDLRPSMLPEPHLLEQGRSEGCHLGPGTSRSES